MSPHLGDRLSAFIDGELGHSDRERVLAHLTRCLECRGVVDAERQLKARLSGLDAPQPSSALLAKLRDLPAPATPTPGSPTVGTRRPRSVGGSRRPARSPGPLRGHRLRRAATTTGAVVAVALSTAFAVGGSDPNRGPQIRPQVDQFTVEHASVSGTVPLVDPASLVGGGAP
jgi:anti-sigma factor RsiW